MDEQTDEGNGYEGSEGERERGREGGRLEGTARMSLTAMVARCLAMFVDGRIRYVRQLDNDESICFPPSHPPSLPPSTFPLRDTG